ncbi:OmpA family protein [Algoriphagus boseongensis]|uniref:OmpA family protein n=1 Tax=Algoriphagus boseongensis TaxID=1442587 RepID=A0A4R6TBV3_9BACT|nr:OmpA family protein [Algoriphagus boseongensis]TDQ19165.1 OmpA family protein [Algoriphagus boseongensis]
MKNNNTLNLKASSLVLLAFCLLTTLQAQEIKSLSGANSPNDDTNPVWIGNNTLLFTRAFHPENIGGISDPGDIWMTQKDDSGEWKTAVHRADLSSSGFDLALGLEDVLTLLILRQENNRVSIHQYSKFGMDWNYLRRVNFPEVQIKSGFASGRVLEGGKQILFSAHLEGSFGNEDIYVSEKSGPVEWSTLQSLGPVINGKGQDIGPYFNSQKQELFFSSNSHLEATGKDILISKKIGNTWQSWSLPVKWEQISSRGSEASVTLVEGKEVVWTSTQNSDGFADLLTFATPVPLILPEEFEAPKLPENIQAPTEIKRITILEETQVPEKMVEKEEVIPVQIIEKEPALTWTIVDRKSKVQLTTYQLIAISDSQEFPIMDSIFLSELKEKDLLAIKISASGYFPLQVPISLLTDKTSNMVQLTKAEPGSIVLLENVNFKRGTSELEEDDTQLILDDIAKFLNENPELKIRINGHTDNVGDPGLNKQLSLERAGSVRDFLVFKGIEFERLRISGWGGTRPIASNVTESGRAKNRRVELVVED